MYCNVLCTQRAALITLYSQDGRSPLHRACEKGYKRIVELLVGRSCDLNAVDRGGRSPLLWCIRNDHLDLAYYLLSVNVDIPSEMNELSRDVLCSIYTVHSTIVIVDIPSQMNDLSRYIRDLLCIQHSIILQ